MKTIDIDAIPPELRERRQWVVWRAVERDGKRTKIPYRADGAGRASSSDPSTWATFDAAVAACEALAADGIGFVFTTNDPFCGIDVDRGLPEADRNSIVAALDSYSETSVSGDGVHVIVKAALNGSRNRKGPLEIYDAGRFFVMTGRHVAGTPATIIERQAELDGVLSRYLPEPPPTVSRAVTGISVDLDDHELLEHAFSARNGRDFARLWGGDAGGYPSQSEADLALAGILAFWAGPDEARIDALFRRSGLYRPKWDERRGEGTYGSLTIARALSTRTEFYTPSRPRPLRGAGDRHDHRDDGRDHDRADAPAGGKSVVDADCEPGCSWVPQDLPTSVARRTIEPNALGIYPTKRHLLSGEPDDGKTMVALIASVEEIRAGDTVIYIDLDGMGAEDTYERLRDLGLSDGKIRAQFVYLAPDEPLTEPAARAELDRLIAERKPSLVIVDSYTAALELHGLNPDRGNEVQRLHRLMVSPLAAEDAAILLIDHLPKNREQRGNKFSIGSERKLGLAHVHLGVEVVSPFGRARTGLVKLRSKKDRLARLPRPYVCELELRSDADTGALAWVIRPAADAVSADAFRPTRLMERVSEYLEEQAEPVSRNEIEKSVTGNVAYLRLAMDALVTGGYAEESEGPRRSRLLTSTCRFRENDLVHDLVHRESDDFVQPRPSGSSTEKPQSQAENHDFVQSRPDLVPRSRADLVYEPPLPYRGGGSDETRSEHTVGRAESPTESPGTPPPVRDGGPGVATAARDPDLLLWPDTSAMTTEAAILADAAALVDAGLASWEEPR